MPHPKASKAMEVMAIIVSLVTLVLAGLIIYVCSLLVKPKHASTVQGTATASQARPCTTSNEETSQDRDNTTSNEDYTASKLIVQI